MKVAVVTGGTKGIGYAISEMLLKKGYFVYLTYSQDEGAAESAMHSLKCISANFSVEKVNQGDLIQVGAFTKRIIKQHDRIDCLVCNAGKTIRKKISELEKGEWESVFCVGLNSHVYMIRDWWELLQNESRIVFIGSEMGIRPHSMSVAYGVMKAAVHALAQNLVKEFEGTGTTVNAVAPGFVETEWQKNKPLEIRRNIERKSACHRFAQPSEVAHAVEFCIENAFLNGTIVEINGGYNFK